MIVPQFWAEARLQQRENGRQITVRRFGWSDVSQTDAQTAAEIRVREALARIVSGEKLLRREPKVPYHGAQGLPIREEIVSRHGETIITRNSYGARCLNTHNVLFADVDFMERGPIRCGCAVFVVLALGAVLAGSLLRSRVIGITLFLLAIPLARVIGLIVYKASARATVRARAGALDRARSTVGGFLAKRPEWNCRLYRTPAGLRIMATHMTFNPNDPSVVEFFAEVGADPVYRTMCLNQQCFRARVSGKPWRMGISKHIRPNPGVWPVAPERMHLRTAWVSEYETVAKSFAACRFLESIGSGVIHPEVRPVQELHDELCQALTELPMA